MIGIANTTGWPGALLLVFALAVAFTTPATDAVAEPSRNCRALVPVPGDASVEVPTQAVPQDIARFSGVWIGTWFGKAKKPTLCAGIVVERLHASGIAQVIYTYGAHAPWRTPLPNHYRTFGRVQDGTLQIRSRGGAALAFALDNNGRLTGTRNGRGRAELRRVAGMSEIGCTGANGAQPPAPSTASPRDRVTADELRSPVTAEMTPVHNAYFMPVSEHQPPAHTFEGRLTIAAQDISRSSQGCPGEPLASPVWTLDFLTVDDILLPAVRDFVMPGDPASAMRMIVSPGRVWREAGDGGWSRASFPFVWTTSSFNMAHNGIATFLYNDREVSDLRLQIVQETAPRQQWAAAAQVPMTYRPGPIDGGAGLRKRYAAERAMAWPMSPLSGLTHRVPATSLRDFAGLWGQAQVSAAGLVVDGHIYTSACGTRYGAFPYCRHMRHGVFSVTKSMGAALALLRLARMYGPEVFDLKIVDYVEPTADRHGWAGVTFGDALNMAVGVGPSKSNNRRGDWRFADSRGEKLKRAFAAPDDPAEPGEATRYDGLHTFTLGVAMEAFYRGREGPDADLWDMVRRDVLEPIGVFHAPIRRTTEPDGQRGTPIFAYGLYPTLEDAAKIADLLQMSGEHNGQQLLHAGKTREALYRGAAEGLPTSQPNRFGQPRYHMSLWSAPYVGDGGCSMQIPYMAGYGGNLVVLLPNGVTAIRFSDGYNSELLPMIRAGEAVRPLCPGAAKPPAAGENRLRRVSTTELNRRLPGNTLRARYWHLHLAPDGTAVGANTKTPVLGTWRIDDAGHVCTRYAHMRGGSENCYELIERDDALQLHAIDRLWMNKVTVEQGNPEGY